MNNFFDELRIRLFELIGITQADLVATLEHIVAFADEEDDETITYYLRQFPSGRRFYSVHCYGASESCNLDKQYAADVVAWVFGGPLPKNAEVVRKTAVVLNVFEGGANDPK